MHTSIHAELNTPSPPLWLILCTGISKYSCVGCMHCIMQFNKSLFLVYEHLIYPGEATHSGVLQTKFGNIMATCLQQLQQCQVSVHAVRDTIITVFFQEDRNNELCESFIGAGDIDDIFITLTVHGLWDYRNIFVLKEFGKMLESPKVTDELDMYKEALDSYNLSNEVGTQVREIIPPANLFEWFKVTLEASTQMEEKNMKNISYLSASIAERLGLNMAVFLLKTIINCPFEVTWFIPTSSTKEIQNSFSNHEEWFKAQNVIKVELKKYGLLPSIMVCGRIHIILNHIRLFVVTLHCLQRFHRNVDHWGFNVAMY